MLITIIFGTIIQNRVAIAWQKQQQVINPVETAGVTALVPQNVKTKVILFAWDGACWEIITPLLQQGKLPNLQRLITQGATGRIKSMRPTKSPVIWTVIVTGKPPAQNGVFEFVRIANIPGIPEEFPITTTSELTPIEFRLFPVAEKLGLCSMVQNQQTDRQVKAIWNILSEQKKTVGIINFWNTYPPEPVNGFMIPHFLDIHAHHQGQITYPPSLYAAISASIPQELPITHKQLLRYIPILKNKPALVLPQGKEEQELYQFLVNLGERWDTFVARIGKQLFQQLHPDLLCIYFEGGDMVSHKAWKYYYPEQFWGVSAKEVALFREILPNYYIFLDQQLGEFLNLMDENTVFIVMSDHGFHAIPAWKEFLYSRITGPYISADHYLAPDGIIVVAGKGVKPNSQITSASVFDITPTLLWLFGLPTAEDMTGTVINSVFDEHIYGSIRKIPTYEFTKRNTITSTTRQVLTPEMVEQLKSLGYIGK
ncbi:MAG: alkaline phosphatase family protein [bacterium]|nr:alkaline phosphatase family protein [bacterium]